MKGMGFSVECRRCRDVRSGREIEFLRLQFPEVSALVRFGKASLAEAKRFAHYGQRVISANGRRRNHDDLALCLNAIAMSQYQCLYAESSSSWPESWVILCTYHCSASAGDNGLESLESRKCLRQPRLRSASCPHRPQAGTTYGYGCGNGLLVRNTPPYLVHTWRLLPAIRGLRYGPKENIFGPCGLVGKTWLI